MTNPRRARYRCAALAAVAWTGLVAAPSWADVRLPRIFGKHMVLQREQVLPIWGWADQGEEVTVTMNDFEIKTLADADGRWSVKLPAMPAGGPYALIIAGKNRLRLDDVLVGEVWLCSGQSNMEMGVRSIDNSEQEIAAADYPSIRLIHVPRTASPAPLHDIDCEWFTCRPETLGGGSGYSAVAYFFGRELYRELNVPIGLIESAWGGTRIEPWTPPEGFAAVPAFRETVDKIVEAGPAYLKAAQKALPEYEAWLPAARHALDAGECPPRPPTWPRHALEDAGAPTALYNGMIHPLAPFALRGAIWYQGESNHKDGLLYRDRMEALITGWRQVWGQGAFPFYYVQIAPLGSLYTGEQLPRLWEAQTAALSIPNTGMAVTVDIGDLKDIHPRNKVDVGKRLALWALAKTYGRTDVMYSGPLYKSMGVEGDKIRLRFDHVDGGLAARDEQPLTWFEIAGADRKFVSATATVDGETIVVRSDEVPAPVAVRFAWDQKAQPNLSNKAGLPASPFRTDDWDEPAK